MDGPRGEEPLLPGAAPMTGTDRGPRRGPSFLVIAAVGLGVAAVVGLLIGAVWGLSSQQSAPPAAAPVAPVPSTSEQTPGPTRSTPPQPTPTQPTPEQPTPSQPTPDETSEPPAPPPPSGEAGPDDFPAAPASSQQSSHKWQVGRWQITNTGGTIGMQATLTNSHKKARSGSFTMYLYVDGRPLATLTGSATDVPGGGSVPVTFSSNDKWGPGTKTLLFVATP